MNNSLCVTDSCWEKGRILLVLFERQHVCHKDIMLSYVAGEQRAVLGVPLLYKSYSVPLLLFAYI